eukprot:14739765-Alexandrium_andersonii.AAC.1
MENAGAHPCKDRQEGNWVQSRSLCSPRASRRICANLGHSQNKCAKVPRGCWQCGQAMSGWCPAFMASWGDQMAPARTAPVSYTHLRAHETSAHL